MISKSRSSLIGEAGSIWEVCVCVIPSCSLVKDDTEPRFSLKKMQLLRWRLGLVTVPRILPYFTAFREFMLTPL